MSRIVRYFPETSLINGHRGLSKIAHKNGVDLRLLPAGEFLLFVNKRQTAFKMITQNNVLLHYKNPRTGRLNPGVFALIPKYFDGKEFNYDGALNESIRRDFGVQQVLPAKKVWSTMSPPL